MKIYVDDLVAMFSSSLLTFHLLFDGEELFQGDSASVGQFIADNTDYYVVVGQPNAIDIDGFDVYIEAYDYDV